MNISHAKKKQKITKDRFARTLYDTKKVLEIVYKNTSLTRKAIKSIKQYTIKGFSV